MAQDSTPQPRPAVNVRYDDFVAQVNPEPSAARGGAVLSGFVGKAHAAGDVRVYGDHSLTSWVDVAAADVVHAVELPAATSPLGGSVLWVKSDARLTPGSAASTAQPQPQPQPQMLPTATVLTAHQSLGIACTFIGCQPPPTLGQTLVHTCPQGCAVATQVNCPTHPVFCTETMPPTRAPGCQTAATVCTQVNCPTHPVFCTETMPPTQQPACHTAAAPCTQIGACMHPTTTLIPTAFCFTQPPNCEQTGFVGHCGPGFTHPFSLACRQGTFTPFGNR